MVIPLLANQDLTWIETLSGNNFARFGRGFTLHYHEWVSSLRRREQYVP